MQPGASTGSALPDERFMRLALAEARSAAEAGEVPIGAVAVRDGRVLATGQNRTRRDGVVCAHAELVCLGAAERVAGDFRLEGCELYVTVEPCLMCLGALLQARVAQLVYGAREPKFGALGSRFDLAGHPALRDLSVRGGILADEAAQLLAGFFRRLRSAL